MREDPDLLRARSRRWCCLPVWKWEKHSDCLASGRPRMDTPTTKPWTLRAAPRAPSSGSHFTVPSRAKKRILPLWRDSRPPARSLMHVHPRNRRCKQSCVLWNDSALCFLRLLEGKRESSAEDALQRSARLPSASLLACLSQRLCGWRHPWLHGCVKYLIEHLFGA